MIELNNLTNLYLEHYCPVAYLDKAPKIIFVTFSEGSPCGNGKPFGLNFFKKNNIEAFFITHRNGNFWWHTPEIDIVAKEVLKQKEKTGKKIVLFGYSMGGYAACHLRNLFQSDLGIGIAPQIFVNTKILDEHEIDGVTCIPTHRDKIYKKDNDFIQSRMIFCEKNNLIQQRGNFFAFYDYLYIPDSIHMGLAKNFKKFPIINVPYSNHNVVKLMTKTGAMQSIIFDVIKNIPSPLKKWRFLCKDLYLQDKKCFFDYFRKNFKEKNTYLIDNLNNYLSNTNDLDYEGLHLAAECLIKIKKFKESLELMQASIELYKSTYKEEPPKYLILKLNYIYNLV